nr:MAG TPA: hypothetical protein [Caudoviricetes sp.]
MSDAKNLPIENNNSVEDDSPIISINTAKIKKLAAKALPYAITGAITIAAMVAAAALASSDDVDPIVIDKNDIDEGPIELDDGTFLNVTLTENPEITED